MENTATYTDVLLKGIVEINGECETHGKASIYRPKFLADRPWACPTCSQIKAKAEAERLWIDERRATLHRIAGVPSKYQGSKFEAVTAVQKGVRSTVKAFRDAIASKQHWAVLVLFGGVGTGKTLLATELAEALIDNLSMSVRYCTAKQMISEIQASYNTEGKSEEGEVLRFVQYQLLILDEIDAKPDRENANLLLTEVINRRYNEEKPVVVITNQPFDGLAKFVGDRVDDRLHENAFVCSFDWPSFRRR
jgi:DNA replication protein DnaC